MEHDAKVAEIDDLTLQVGTLQSDIDQFKMKVESYQADLTTAQKKLESEKTVREGAFIKLGDAERDLKNEKEKLDRKTEELSQRIIELNQWKQVAISEGKKSSVLSTMLSVQSMLLSEKDGELKKKDEDLRREDEEIATLKALVTELEPKTDPFPHIQKWVREQP